MTLDVFKRVVVQGRQLRLQSFNNYRQQFGMKRCQSFLELTGDASMAKELETIYGHIDALEFYPGLPISTSMLTYFDSIKLNLQYPRKVHEKFVASF